MRTTLTLDDDVSARIRGEMKRSGRSLKATVNDLLRAALARSGGSRVRRFEVRPRPLGVREGLDYDDVSELIDRIEGPEHR